METWRRRSAEEQERRDVEAQEHGDLEAQKREGAEARKSRSAEAQNTQRQRMNDIKIGKVPNKLLEELVIGKMNTINDRVLLSGGIGEDFGVLDFGGECCIVSSDPITGTVKNAGKLAVHVACNDIATCGIRPTAILTTLLLPPGTREAELGALADDIAAAASMLGVSVIGGHTEVTDAVNRTVISVTAIGAAPRGGYVATGGAGVGDALVMTKSAGLEGTAIIAAEREVELRGHFGAEFTDAAKRLSDDISVVAEGVVSGAFGVNAMHDATEGGVYGAAWEMAEACGGGIRIYADKINVLGVTRDICSFYDIDAFRLVSSGSMLIATDKPGGLIRELEAAGIRAAAIGEFLENPLEREIMRGGAAARLDQPGPDELYKVLQQQ